VTPIRNDGKTIYNLRVKDVPVDGFWSISLYNREGYFEKNDRQAYTLNNVTAKKDADGSVTIQFGGCDGKTTNYLPIIPGWNYMVRLYRPPSRSSTEGGNFPKRNSCIEARSDSSPRRPAGIIRSVHHASGTRIGTSQAIASLTSESAG
jgi:hypothetical protein